MSKRNMLGNERGATALEFAFLAPVFFILLFALIDLSFFFGVHAVVDDAVENAARAVRLGVLTKNDGGASFRKAMCSHLVLISCDKFSYSVQVANDLGSVDPVPQIDSDGQIENANYDPGGPEDMVVITIVYVHHFLIPYIGDIFGDTGLSDPMSRAIVSFLVVKNEPFPQP